VVRAVGLTATSHQTAGREEDDENETMAFGLG